MSKLGIAIIAFILGGFVGVALMAICVAGRDN